MSVILAIDLGKYNSVFCWFETSSGEVRFRMVKSTPQIDDAVADARPATDELKLRKPVPDQRQLS